MDNERLIRIETNQKWIIKMLTNHLKHHFMITIGMITSCIGLVTALIVALI